MNVIALRRRAQLSDDDKRAGVLSSVYPSEKKAEMVAQCDYVAMATPYTDATHKLFDEECVNAMKSTAVFVNVGRGKCVDEEALTEALQQGADFACKFLSLSLDKLRTNRCAYKQSWHFVHASMQALCECAFAQQRMAAGLCMVCHEGTTQVGHAPWYALRC